MGNPVCYFSHILAFQVGASHMLDSFRTVFVCSCVSREIRDRCRDSAEEQQRRFPATVVHSGLDMYGETTHPEEKQRFLPSC